MFRVLHIGSVGISWLFFHRCGSFLSCVSTDILGLSPFHFAALVSTVATAPLMFILSFKKLSWLSLLGCMSTVLVTVTVLLAVGLDPLRTHMPKQVPAPLTSCRTSL